MIGPFKRKNKQQQQALLNNNKKVVNTRTNEEIEYKNTPEYWRELSANVSRGGSPEFKKKKRRFFHPIGETYDLYDELIYSLFAGNDSLNSRIIYNEPDKIGVDFLGTYEGDEVSFYYLVDSYPENLRIDWKEILRREGGPGIRISFIEDIKGHRIDWNSPQMASKLRILKDTSDDLNEKNVSAYNIHKVAKDLSRQEWIENSLQYLADAEIVRGRQNFKFAILVVVSGRRGEHFNDAIRQIENRAKDMRIGWQRVMYEIPEYLEYFMPFRYEKPPALNNQIPHKVIPDEIIARFSTYSQGIIGKGGTYFGTDIYSKFPVLKEVKRTPESAENILITAETGGGKSFAVKVLALQLLAQGFNGTIMDIEGSEYKYIGNFISQSSKVLVVNMAEGTGKYFDPMAIAPKTGIEDIDKDARTMSIDFTLSMFQVLLGESYKQNRRMETFLNKAIVEVYRDAGVTEDDSTWHLSKNLEMRDLYEKIYSLQRSHRNKLSEEERAVAEEAYQVLSKFFEPDGTRAALFREKINVEDLVDADLVICSFGMEGKSETTVDTVQLALMQLGAAHLSHQRSIFSKKRGKYNFKIWEEFQRWGKFPGSEKTLGVAITGGRKLGDVNIIVTNVVKDLLDDDKFGVFSNVTSFICGAISDANVRREFCNRLSVPRMTQELDKITTEQKGMEKEVYYVDSKGREVVQQQSPRPKFLVGLDKSSFGIVQFVVYKALADSALLRTGVDKSLKEKGE